VKPKIAPSMFPAPKSPEPDTPQQPNTSKRRAEPANPVRKRSTNSEDFGDDGIDDDELMKVSVGDLEFEHIDNFANPMDAITRKNTAKNKTAKARSQVKPTTSVGTRMHASTFAVEKAPTSHQRSPLLRNVGRRVMMSLSLRHAHLLKRYLQSRASCSSRHRSARSLPRLKS
jgi:hypothetical protein